MKRLDSAGPVQPSWLFWIGTRFLGRSNRDYIVGDLLETLESRTTQVGPRDAMNEIWCELSLTVFWDGMARLRKFVSFLFDHAPAGAQMANAGGVLADRSSRIGPFVGMTALLGILLVTYFSINMTREVTPLLHVMSWPGTAQVGPSGAGDRAEWGLLVKQVNVGGGGGTDTPAPLLLAAFSLPQVHARFSPVAVLGRTLRPGDETYSIPAAVLSEQTWRTQFLGSEDVLGSALLIDGRPIKVVGVVTLQAAMLPTLPDLWIAGIPPVGEARNRSGRALRQFVR